MQFNDKGKINIFLLQRKLLSKKYYRYCYKK